jgi:dienelactone hydrolase
MLPVTVDGEQVRLNVVSYRPAGNGPFPTLVFHHGSTGRGNNPAAFARVQDAEPVARWFVARGWAVFAPQRRGRGGSEGRYDEGFERDRSQGYSCDPALSLPGAERALRDIEAVTPLLLAQPFVDRSRFVVGGQSRGGILSVAWSGRHPEARAVINFVGGWMASACPTASTINETLFRRGAAFPLPSLWLYGDKDPFYPLSHSRANFAAFTAAGGKGTFHEYPPPSGTHGHNIPWTPALWEETMITYLGERGL